MSSATAQLVVEATADVDDAKRGLTDLRGGMELVTTAAGIVGAAIVGVGVALVDFARQADEQQRQMGRLAFALDAAGLSAERAAPRMEAMFTQLSRISGISDEELREATTAFTTLASAVGLSAGEIESASRLVVDIAAQTGRSAERIARQVADVAAGNVAALASLSPSLRQQATDLAEIENPALRAQQAMALLQDTFGGAAQSAAGAGVNLRVLSNEFGDLQQAIGDQVLASGEFQNSLRTTLGLLREVTDEVNNPRSGLSESLQNVGIIFDATATAGAYLGRVLLELYTGTVTLAESFVSLFASLGTSAFDAVTTPAQALYTLFTEGLGPAIDEIGAGWGRVGERLEYVAGMFGETALSARDTLFVVLGQTPPARVEIDQFGNAVTTLGSAASGTGEAFDFMFDAVETGLAASRRLAEGAVPQLSALFEQARGFAFDFEGGGEARTPTRSGPTGPTDADRAAKVKDTETALQQAREEAARVQLANEAAKNQQLIEIQKLYEEERLRTEAEANAMRVAAAEEAANKIKESEIRAARAAADEQRRLAQQRATIASQSAGLVVGALDIIASGEARTGRERRRELGTLFAAQGRGYLLQAIPEAFLNPARAGALLAGGAGLITLGAAMGGRVFGSGGGGGGGGSAGGAGFGAQSAGLMQPTAPAAAPQPVVINDFASALIVANDPDSFRGVGRRIDDARSAGAGGVL